MSANTGSLHQDRPLIALSFRILALICVAMTFALVKYLEQDGAHIIELIFARYLMGCLLLGGYILLRTGTSALRTNRIVSHFYRALIGICAMGLNFYSVTLMPLAEAATIGFAVPLISTVLSIVFLSEFVGLHRWSAILIGFIGILIAVQPDGSAFTVYGVFIGFAAAFFAAYSGILVRDLAKTEGTATIVFYYMALATPVLAIISIEVVAPHSYDVFLKMALMGGLGTLGMVFFAESMRYANVAVSAPLDYTLFIFSAALGFLIWGDIPGSSIWLGLPLIVGSGVYITYREHARRKKSLEHKV